MAQTHHFPWRETGTGSSLSLKATSSYLSDGVVLWAQSRVLWIPLPYRTSQAGYVTSRGGAEVPCGLETMYKRNGLMASVLVTSATPQV